MRYLICMLVAAVFMGCAGASADAIVPYKSHYSFGEYWAEEIQGTPYKAYARANPIESAKLADLAAKKIAQLPYVLPNGLAKTHEGQAIVMAFCSLPGGGPTTS